MQLDSKVFISIKENGSAGADWSERKHSKLHTELECVYSDLFTVNRRVQ